MITEQGFINTMNALVEVYPKEAPSPNGQKIYFMIFQRNFESDEELQAATYRVLEERVFSSFPKPAEFLEAGKRKEDLETKSIKATVELERAINKIGAYRNVAFDDPLIHRCIIDLFGSWPKLCQMDRLELKEAMKWDFPKVYKMRAQEKIKNIPIYLEGVSTHTNELNGIEEDIKIEYIGDEEKCKKWITAYFSKNPQEKLNYNKYLSLGFDVPKLEMSEPIKQLENTQITTKEMLMEAIENINENKIVRKAPKGIEYTQEQLLKMLKKA